MIPVRTNASNVVYRGPTPDIGDAWVERRPAERAVMLTWKPSDAEREAIAAGALIELGIYGMEPIPPVSVNVSTNRELGAAGVALRDRAQAVLKAAGIPGPTRIPPGYWSVGSDVWHALNEAAALDAGGGIPKLLGRPLMESGVGGMEYVTSPLDQRGAS